MRTLLALTLAAAACGAPQKKPVADEGHDVPATCCCMSTPNTSEDGKPVFEMVNRMECSTKQGECKPDVQCTGSARGGHKDPETSSDGVPTPPALPPSTTSPGG
jgi:hypothetical protein